MKKLLFVGFLGLAMCSKSYAQTLPLLKGVVQDIVTETPIRDVEITISNTFIKSRTDRNGLFFIENISIGSYEIRISLNGYIEQVLPIEILEDTTYDLGIIYFEKGASEITPQSTIYLTEDELTQEGERSSDYIAGLFQSSKDAYMKAAAFNFSQAWFKVRGYDSSYGTILINGLEMNKLYDGRPQWSNWGGLNDALRNQDFSIGLSPSESTFGNLLGTTNFKTRASQYSKGGKVSYAATNKSYTGRVMAMYATGLSKNNWAFVVAGSRRYAKEGQMEGTTYNAWSGFLGIEKKFDDKQSLNLTIIAAFNRRGKSSPSTQEIYDLKGYQYNSYWGYQGKEFRNSRMKETFEPILMLNHYYKLKKGILNTSFTLQKGHIGSSRLGYFKAPNPSPTYWKYLPSSYLRFSGGPDYAGAYIAEQDFLNNGQINWDELYEIIAVNEDALYYEYEDRVDDTQFSFNSILNTQLKEHIILTTGVTVKKLVSENYGLMLDLLGGNGFIDLDPYAVGDAQQSDLNKPNNSIHVGDKFQYNYNIRGTVANAFAQLQVTKKKWEYFTGFNVKSTKFQREGLFKNGTYKNNSFGKGAQQSFSGINFKGGLTYKFTGRHLINLNGAYFSNIPSIKTTFSNARINNFISPNLKNENVITVDLNYIFRSPKLQTRLTGYFSKFKNSMESSFFFAEGLRGDQADFVNEIMTGVDKKHVGFELSTTYQISPFIKLITVGSVGQYTYDNNPNLYLQSESFKDGDSDFGTTYLKDYMLSGTPQRAYSLGFEYSDPAYWWVQLNGNYLSDNYIDISPLLRTNNFYQDSDGLPIIDGETGKIISQDQIDGLLFQEKFEPVFLVNIVGGKSWKVKDYYTGFFIGINNVLGKTFKTGGFEQSRNANYPELKQDKQLNKPIFGPKYWYGNSISFYINYYVRF